MSQKLDHRCCLVQANKVKVDFIGSRELVRNFEQVEI